MTGSCVKQSNADSVCTGASLNPIYGQFLFGPSPWYGTLMVVIDTSVLAKTTPFPPSPPQTSPQWMLISIVFLTTYLLLTALPSIPKMPAAVCNMLNKPSASRVIAWLGILGWFAGLTTAIVLRVMFGNDCSAFNQYAVDSKVEMVAVIGDGFNLFWVAYALAVPSLICSLFKIHLEGKSA